MSLACRNFYFDLVYPPPGGPGEGPDSHSHWKIDDFGLAPARIRGVIYFEFVFWP